MADEYKSYQLFGARAASLVLSIPLLQDRSQDFLCLKSLPALTSYGSNL